jgi:hypothetical protein
MAEDGVDDVGVKDERDDSHGSAAARTSERVDFEDALQEFRPSLSHGLQRRSVGYCVIGT